MESCILCEQIAQLKHSHIIPKFVFKWLKETGSGYLRGGDNFNIRVQDGPAYEMLCAKCEQSFGNEETYFASRIFYPIVNEEARGFAYDERFFRFVVSVIWRLLKQDFVRSENDQSYLKLLVELETDYRNYLLGKKAFPDFNRVHLLCGVDVRAPKESEQIELPLRFIHYFARQVDAGVTGNDEHKFVYFKLPRMLFIVPIQGLNEESFVNTKISFTGGSYQLDEAGMLEPLIGNYFYQRVIFLDQELSNLSSKQKDNLAKVTNEKWDEVQQKDLGKILNYQQAIFNEQRKI
jgi:hypothetical protein